MRLEDLSLSAFIAGTAIGYLLWFLLRGGGARSDLRKHRFLAATAIACGSFLAVVLVVELWDLDSLFSSHRILSSLGGLLAIALIAAIIWHYWPRGEDNNNNFVLEFEVTLAILFTFVLSFLIIILLWGPQSLYLRSLNQWFITAPLGALVLGIMCGGVGGEWVQYILLPTRMRSKALGLAHRRWGYALIALVVLGILYPVLPQLARSLGSANVTTPIGGLSFTIQNVQSLSGVAKPQSGQHTVETASTARSPWPSLAALGAIANRDLGYLDLFVKSNSDNMALKSMHRDTSGFLSDVLVPLGSCIDDHSSAFRSPQMALIHLAPVLGAYRAAVHNGASQEHLTLLRDKIAQAAHEFGVDLSGNKNCSNAESSAKAWKPQISAALPYFAMGLAFLYYDGDAIDQAAVELAQWIDGHFGGSAAEAIDNCNSPKSAVEKCAEAGYFADGRWHQLPVWYKIRAEFDLAAILGSNSHAALATFLNSKTTAEDLDTAMKLMAMGSMADWTTKCPTATVLNNSEVDLQRRMVLAYATMVDQMLKYLITLTDAALANEEASITPRMLDYADANTKIKFSCFPVTEKTTPDDSIKWNGQLVSWQAQFRATYGIVVAQAIARREPPYGLSDLERAGRNQSIIDARANLLRAIDVLKARVYDQKTKNKAKSLEDQLFFYTDEEQSLRQAQAKLDELNALLR